MKLALETKYQSTTKPPDKSAYFFLMYSYLSTNTYIMGIQKKEAS